MKSLIKIFLLISMISLTSGSYGQIKLDLNKTVKKGINSVKGALNKKDEPTQQKQAQENKQVQETKSTDGNNNADANKENPSTVPQQPELEAYSKYDFIPGEKIIFFEDFSQDKVGDFPILWNTNGSAEVVTTNLFPGNWMKFSGRGTIWTDALLKLPENYTIEFDVIPVKGEDGNMSGYHFRLMQCSNPKGFDPGSAPGKAAFHFTCEYFGRPGYSTYINGPEGEGMALSGVKEGNDYLEKLNQKYHVAVWFQKGRIRLYLDQNKILDLPKAFALQSVKMDRIRFEEGAAMVSNIRVAVGAPDMRNKLLTEGKLVSYGIYFDVNKDVVKPESYSTLKEIAAVLSENPGVKVKIVGHTDSDGVDVANLDLSKRRSASVKNELVKTFGIDASRLESDGMGKTQPVAPNDSPANKALNRRVEFIKL